MKRTPTVFYVLNLPLYRVKCIHRTRNLTKSQTASCIAYVLHTDLKYVYTSNKRTYSYTYIQAHTSRICNTHRVIHCYCLRYDYYVVARTYSGKGTPRTNGCYWRIHYCANVVYFPTGWFQHGKWTYLSCIHGVILLYTVILKNIEINTRIIPLIVFNF
jgi:hypothetical protein